MITTSEDIVLRKIKGGYLALHRKKRISGFGLTEAEALADLDRGLHLQAEILGRKEQSAIT